jgi:hypothetical protein
VSRVTTCLIAAAIAVAGLASASSAQALRVSSAITHNGTGEVGIGGWEPGERNDVTVTPSGAVYGGNSIDPVFPLLPTSVVVRDAATPLSDATDGCVRIDANSARCTAPSGFADFTADLGPGGGRFTVDVHGSGLVTPMWYSILTRDGDDDISIPVSRGLTIDTNSGNDTIAASNPSTTSPVLIRSGAGDDEVRLASAATVSEVNCGDGSDSAVIVATATTNTNCESVTP